MENGNRRGARERVLEAHRAHPDLLEIRTHSLVTNIVIEDGRAVGVDYLAGARLYEADPASEQAHGPGDPRTVRARREVILAGGAYNTPQVLMLSGIGPREHLESLGIPVLVDAPGVGRNLQDRYEVCVVEELHHDYPVFDGHPVAAPGRDGAMNPLYAEWFENRTGPYATNGSLAALMATSTVATDGDPDLYVMALPVDFHGYYPGYAAEGAAKLDRLTLLVLKGHTENQGGTVTLAGTDPKQRPEINFHYFAEGTDRDGRDLTAVQEGVAIARRIADRIPFIQRELIPGDDVQGDEVGQWVQDNAWGHHASCSAKIGTDDDPDAVLDGDFRVRGVAGLRVVDASVFPRIPGLFICSAVYMVSERAADVIIADHSAPWDGRH